MMTVRDRCPNNPDKLCQFSRDKNKSRLGSKLQDFTQKVLKCCEGFTISATKDKCIPICEHECFNGNCTLPNVCSCLKGYIPQTDDPNRFEMGYQLIETYKQ